MNQLDNINALFNQALYKRSTKIKTSTSSTDIVQTDATKSSTTKHDLFDKDILCHGRKHNVLCSIKNVFIILFHFFKF